MNKSRSKFIGLFLCITTLVMTESCQDNGNECISSDVIDIQFDSLPYGSLIDSMKCDYVKLETSDECLISKIKKIAKDDSLLFIFDKKGSILKFNTEGRFLGRIGSKGGANNEYIIPFDVVFDTKSKNIIVLDVGKRDLVKYDYNGTFLGRDKWPIELFTRRVEFQKKDENYYAYNYNSDKTPYKYTIYNSSNGEIKDVVPYRVIGKKTVRFDRDQICSTSKAIYGITIFSDTIYRLTDREAVPAFCLNGPLKKCTSKDFKGLHPDHDTDLCEEFMKHDKSSGLSLIYATDSVICFQYGWPVVNILITYNYHTGKGAREFRHGKMSNELIYSDDTCFISAKSAYDCLQLQYPDDALKQIIEQTDAEDNPILAIYH